MHIKRMPDTDEHTESGTDKVERPKFGVLTNFSTPQPSNTPIIHRPQRLLIQFAPINLPQTFPQGQEPSPQYWAARCNFLRSIEYTHNSTNSYSKMTKQELMEQCFALQDFARGVHNNLVREREINDGRLGAREVRLRATEVEYNGKIDRHNERVERLSEDRKRFSKRVEQLKESTVRLNEKEDRLKERIVDFNEKEVQLNEREEQLRKREQLIEWGFEQQEAVLVEANEKGISLAGAVIEQRILLQQGKFEDHGDGDDTDDSDEVLSGGAS